MAKLAGRASIISGTIRPACQRRHVAVPAGVHAFLRAYYHHKSADWRKNKPFGLKGWTAEELAKMPTYYIMDLGETMAETVAHEMPSPAEIAACRWLPDKELAVYSAEYQRTVSRAVCKWYRRGTETHTAELQLFSGRTIDVPALLHRRQQRLGDLSAARRLERMQETACTRMQGCHLIAAPVTGCSRSSQSA